MLARPAPPSRRALVLLLPLLGACEASHDKVNHTLLEPSPAWVAEPTDLGLQAIAADIPVGDGVVLHGWLIPHADAHGRTVVLFHDHRSNISMLHPYYTFLHDAGLNVFAFDYRGFGRSNGTPSVRAMVYDLRYVFAWLLQRPEVDQRQLVYYGQSLGSTVALYAAANQQAPAALVLEEVPSPHDRIQAQAELQSGGKGVGADITAGFIEFGGLPEGMEPDANIAKLTVPLLAISGADAPRGDLFALLRTWIAAGSDKQLWLLPATGQQPNSLLTQDGQYQKTVTGFLTAALAGPPPRLEVQWRKVAAADTGDGSWCEVTVQRRNVTDQAPWPIEVCAIDKAGATSFHDLLLAGSDGSFRLKLPAEPGVVAAVRLLDAEVKADGTVTRVRSPLSRAGKLYEQLAPDVDLLRHGAPQLADCRRIAGVLQQAEAKEPLHPRLGAELADAFFVLGKTLVASTDAADQAAGRSWLERAVAAAPKQPKLHSWPAKPFTVGYPQAESVQQARALLQQLDGK
ncbi:MAG TPA: alpha/beta hydrolase [Planctomycetota bacterium]|nr:alpha/beta hydrolase [Planctomycetota bacterium]